MEDITFKNVKRKLNWKEKIIVKIFPKTFTKVFYVTKIEMIKKVAKSANKVYTFTNKMIEKL